MITAESSNRTSPLPLNVTVGEAPLGGGQTVLGECAFGTASPGAVCHYGLTPLYRPAGCEIWRAQGAVTEGNREGVAWRADDHLLFGWTTVSMNDDVAATRACYRALFRCAAQQGYPHLLRIWNFIPGINRGAGDGERYKRFCLGRAQAFDDSELARDQYPAGTAIGSRDGSALLVYFIASTHPGTPVENPRQVNAPQYPRRYGPRSPRFSRAMAWPGHEGAMLLVSGTASIVGHESRHGAEVEQQFDETWRNLDALCENAGGAQPVALRVYLRHQHDYPTVRRLLEQRLDQRVPVVYLCADICRAELMLEIEGVYALTPGAI